MTPFRKMTRTRLIVSGENTFKNCTVGAETQPDLYHHQLMLHHSSFNLFWALRSYTINSNFSRDDTFHNDYLNENEFQWFLFCCTKQAKIKFWLESVVSCALSGDGNKASVVTRCGQLKGLLDSQYPTQWHNTNDHI